MFFVDENRNVYLGRNAAAKLKVKNDTLFLRQGQGVMEVDTLRWKEAQRYERRTWMEGGGLYAREDRNSEHERQFENYRAIRGCYFGNVIEIGCGPFTNMVRILRHIRCKKVTLLDPLAKDYLSHPHCVYKRKRLGRWFGKKVNLIAEPVENFSTDQMFNLVVMINVLEHCFSVSNVFKRILSIMPPNGLLVFHSKLVPASEVDDFFQNIYDAGHPIRVTENVILDFLSKNYDELFRKCVPVSTPAYRFDSIYFIGRKR